MENKRFVEAARKMWLDRDTGSLQKVTLAVAFSGLDPVEQELAAITFPAEAEPMYLGFPHLCIDVHDTEEPIGSIITFVREQKGVSGITDSLRKMWMKELSAKEFIDSFPEGERALVKDIIIDLRVGGALMLIEDGDLRISKRGIALVKTALTEFM